MPTPEKEQVLRDTGERIRDASGIFLADFSGMTVEKLSLLRKKCREQQVQFRVIKNTLSERAADKAGAEGLKELLVGPTAMTFVRGDAAAAAKALRDFHRANQLLEFKGGWMNGAALSADEIQSIAQLPSREVLYGRLVGMVASPLTGLASAMNGLIGGLARQLSQIAEQGLVGGDAPTTSQTENPQED